MKNELLELRKNYGNELIEYINSFQVMSDEDKKFLSTNKELLQNIMIHTYMWRTDNQKRSIVSDDYHPTIHSKFHQSILEQKVQFEQAILLAKDFEVKKLEVEEIILTIEEIQNEIQNYKNDNDSLKIKKAELKLKKAKIDLQFKQFEIQQIQVAMKYRMKEIKGWKNIEDELIVIMKKDGWKEDDIWDKEAGEVETMFFLFLNNLQALPKATDTAEVNNLIALAKFAVNHAFQKGMLDIFLKKCNKQQIEALLFLKKQCGLEIDIKI